MVILMLLLSFDLASGLSNERNHPRKIPTLLSFGNACVDQLAICDHFPQPDEKMHSSELRFEGGGNAANTACAVGRLSDYARVHVATAIGNDDYGDRIVKGLTDNGVGVESIERFEGISAFSYILVTPNPNARTIIHQPATRSMTVDFADKIDLSQFTAVHFDGRQQKAAVHVANKCRRLNIPYSVDVERPRGEGHAELLAGASLIMCSSDYCNKVLGTPQQELSEPELVERLRQVAHSQAPNAVLALQTIGSRGSYLIRLKGDDDFDRYQDDAVLQEEGDSDVPTVTCQSGALWCPPWGGNVDIVDSTGAGDAFQGGFLTGLWRYVEAYCTGTTTAGLERVPSEALARAMRIGTRVATKKLESLGARTGLPYSSKDAPLKREFQSLLALESKNQNVQV